MVSPQDPDRVEALIPVVYERLRGLAQRYIKRHPGDTVRPTALVHEAWLKLERHDAFDSREHFCAVAAKAMRQILVDRARSRGRMKRGSDPERTTISGLAADVPDVDVIDLHAALEELERIDPRGAKVVELRYFGGLSTAEVATWLGVSQRSIQLSWRLSRAWLVDRLGGESPATS